MWPRAERRRRSLLSETVSSSSCTPTRLQAALAKRIAVSRLCVLYHQNATTAKSSKMNIISILEEFGCSAGGSVSCESYLRRAGLSCMIADSNEDVLTAGTGIRPDFKCRTWLTEPMQPGVGNGSTQVHSVPANFNPQKRSTEYIEFKIWRMDWTTRLVPSLKLLHFAD